MDGFSYVNRVISLIFIDQYKSITNKFKLKAATNEMRLILNNITELLTEVKQMLL